MPWTRASRGRSSTGSGSTPADDLAPCCPCPPAPGGRPLPRNLNAGAARAWWPIQSSKLAGPGIPRLGRFDSFAASLAGGGSFRDCPGGGRFPWERAAGNEAIASVIVSGRIPANPREAIGQVGICTHPRPRPTRPSSARPTWTRPRSAWCSMATGSASIAIASVRAGPPGEDVAAETFRVAFDRRSDYDGREDAAPWLYGIASNLLRGWFRSAARRERALRGSAGHAGGDDIEDALER